MGVQRGPELSLKLLRAAVVARLTSVSDSLWTPRIEDRFTQIDKDLSRIEQDVRILWPLSKQVGTIEADVEALERGVIALREDLRELRSESAAAVKVAEGVARTAESVANQNMTQALRDSRADFVKLVVAFVGAFAVIAAALIGAIAKGLI